MAKWWQNKTVQRESEPWLCLACNFVGVLATTILPSTIIAVLYPATLIGITTISPAAALVLAILVYDNRSAARWQAAHRAPTSKKIIRAISDGIMWGPTISALALRKKEK